MLFLIGLLIGCGIATAAFLYFRHKAYAHEQRIRQELEQTVSDLKTKLQKLKEEEANVKKTKSFHDMHSALKYLDDVLKRVK